MLQKMGFLILSLWLGVDLALAGPSVDLKQIVAQQQAQVEALKVQVKELQTTLEGLNKAHAVTDGKVNETDKRLSLTAETLSSTADALRSVKIVAAKAAEKRCYITGSAFGHEWYVCPYGGQYSGGLTFNSPVAGVNKEEVWKVGNYVWMCCT